MHGPVVIRETSVRARGQVARDRPLRANGGLRVLVGFAY